jgi:hypothetical protein
MTHWLRPVQHTRPGGGKYWTNDQYRGMRHNKVGSNFAHFRLTSHRSKERFDENNEKRNVGLSNTS